MRFREINEIKNEKLAQNQNQNAHSTYDFDKRIIVGTSRPVDNKTCQVFDPDKRIVVK